MSKNRLAALTLGAALSTFALGCSTTTTNTNANGNTVPANVAVATNNNGNTNTAGITTTGNANTTVGSLNANITREEFNRDRARYEAEARAGGRKIGSGANDLWIHTKTRAALATTDDLRDSTINVDVDNNVVTLTGTVATAAQKNKAATSAMGIEGVTKVNNELKVSPNDSVLTPGTGAANGNANMNGNMNRNVNR